MKKTHNLLAVMMLLVNIVLQPILSIQEVFAEEASSETVMDSTVITSVVEEVSEIPEEIQDTEPIIPEESSEVIDSPTSEGEEEPVGEGEFVSSEDTEETAETSDSEEIEETEESEDETDKEAITTISLNNSNNTTTNLRTGSTSRFSFNVSNTGDVLENAVIRVTVPLTYLATHDSLGQFFPNQGLDSLLSSSVEGNNLIVDYNVQTLSESYNTNFTFEFKSIDDGSMTNGSQIPVQAAVVERGSLLAQTSNVTYQFVTRQPHFSTNVTYPAEASDEDDEDAQRPTEVLFSFSFGDEGGGNGSGRSAVNSITVTAIVPESLTFDASYNEAWQYDEASRTASYSFTPDASIYDAAYSMPATLSLVATNDEEDIQESIYAEATFAFANGDVVTKSNQAEVSMMAAMDIAPMGITSNPVTGFTFEIYENNEWKTIGNGETVTIDPETISATRLNYELDFDNELDVIVPGETYIFQLPDLVSPFNPTPGPVSLVPEFNISYTVDASGMVTISFPDGWETNDNRELNINLQQNFNKEIFTENVEQEIHIPYTDSESYTAILVGRPELIAGSDYKKGIKTYIVDTDGNIVTDDTNVQANRADWKIRVNDQLGVYDSAIVTDTLSEGHRLVAESVKIYRVNRNKLTGEQIGERVDVTSELGATSADGEFSIDFGAIDDTYEIDYTTIIDPVNPGSENTIIDNLAKIKFNGTTKEYEDGFELEWPMGSDPIIKNGSVDQNDPSKILWTVYYNYEKENLGDVTFIDELSLGEVDPTTLKVYEVTNPQPGSLDPWAGGADWVKPQPVASVNGKNMTFFIPESDGKAYYFTFESTVPGGLVDQDVTNIIDDTNPNTPADEDTVTVTTPLGGATKDGNVVYEDGVPYILWTVTFNQNKVAFDEFAFSDSFDTSLLTLDMESFVLTPDADFDVTPSEDGFNFTLKGTSERKVYTLTYKTTYTEAGLEATNVTNNVDLGWDGDGVGPSEEVGHPVAGIKKEASYVTGEDSDGKARQEIEWLVAFNTNHLVLEDPVLSDRFSPAELEIVPNSFEFYTSDGEVEEALYTYRDVPADTEANTKGYDIQFHGNTDPTIYYVKYRTTIPALNTGANNTATLVWQGNSEKDNANVPIGANEPGASKNGTVERAEDGSSKKINWEIKFNQNNRIIHDLVITDTYTPEDAVLVNEIAIHKADGTPLVQGADGDYVISEPFGEGGFTIEFNDQTEPVEYVLTYSTEYNAYSDNIDAKNEAVVKFLGGKHTISKTITPVVLNVEKKSTGVDTSSKPAVISWAITSNTNLKTLQDAILVDTIEDDQLFVDGSMKLNGEEVTPTWNGTEFTVKLLDGANSHVLTYETQIVSYPSNYGSNHDEYYNKVDLINYSNAEESIKETVSDDATARYYQDGENNNPSKSGEQDPETDLIKWTATVNPDAQPIKNASIRDILDTHQVYYQDADGNYDLVVERLSGENAGVVSSSEYDVEYSEVNGIPQFVLTFNDSEINDTYTLSYSTSLRDEIVGQREVSNTIQVIGYNSETVIEQVENSTTSAKWYFGGSGSSQTLNIKVVKVDADDNSIPLQNVQFQLQDGRGGQPQTFTTDENGEIDIASLRAGRYTLTETEPLPGYQGMDPIYFYLGYGENESAVIDLTNSSWATDDLQRLESAELSLVNEKIKVPVTATKVWEGGQENNRPTVYFQLYRQVDEGEAETVPDAEIKTLAQGTTSVTWENQVAFDDAGNEYTFSVKEVDAEGNDYIPTGYTKVEDGLTVTNTISPIEISVTKLWNDADNQDGLRPKSITANLLADGTQINTVELSEDNEWAYVFENLPVYDNGEEISYTITENAVEHYSTEIVEGVIRNNYTPEETSVTVTKDWQDGHNQDGNRPGSIEVQLTAEGEATDHTAVLNEENNWTATWSGLALNSDGTAIDYSVEEITAVDGYEIAVNDADHGNIILTNSYEPAVTDLTVNKLWDDADNQDGIRPESITVELRANGDIVAEPVELNADNSWTYTWSDLAVNAAGEAIAYEVIESDVPEGYEVGINSENPKEIVITNTHLPAVTELTVNKVWNDGNNQDGLRPESIQVQLMAGEDAVGNPVTLDGASSWTHTWTELPANASGKRIEYSVIESTVPEGYEATTSENVEGVITITNTHTPAVVNIPVSKVWNDSDDQDGVRPATITANLLADGDSVENIELSADNEWAHTFENLPVYKDGSIVNYTVTEDTVEDYSTMIEGTVAEGFVITNSYTPDETSVTVTKNWQDGNNQDGNRPESIEVQLTADGEATDHTAVLTEENNWTATWSGLALNSDGTAIDYSVKETTAVDGYEVVVDAADHGNIILTNSYEPAVTDLTVNKVWDDAENQDGIQPELVEVQLIAGNQKYGDPVTLNADNNWSYTWTDLAVNAAGEAIEYSLVEVNVPEGYTSTIGENVEGVITITNAHIPAVVNISVSKVWDDADNQDGNRPVSIEVQLTANNEPFGEIVVLDADNKWTHTWGSLAVNEAGEEITYEVSELNVPEEYEVSINDDNLSNIVITNSYTPKTTELTVNKVWNDGDNQDGLRPESIQVQLMAGEDAVGNPVTLDGASSWTHTWTELPANASGEPIDYSVIESNVPEGYESTIGENVDSVITITNAHTPAVVNIPVSKVWDDADNQDGVRPETITANLLADGDPVGNIELSADNEWTHTFENLPVYNDGSIINYTVTEDTVEDYSTMIEGTVAEGFVITNSYTPDETSVTVTKNWQDGNNQDGNRPESIEVQLTADGEATDHTAVLTEENNWTATWSGLALNSDGTAIDYSVVETTILEGFEVSTDDENHGNIIITNSYAPELVEISGDKLWKDNDDQANNRPEIITVNLLANNVVVATQDISADEDGNWSYSFSGLPAYKSGQLIDYTITEDEVAYYDTEIEAYDIVNTYNPPKVSVGDYVWIDENRDGLQDKTDVPLEGVVLTIVDNDGKPVTDVFGKPVGPQVTDKDGYYSFDNLPIDNTYTVRIDREAFEALYPELTPTIEGAGSADNDSSTWETTSVEMVEDGQRDPTLDFGFVLPNPVLITISGEKLWEDNNNEGNTRPESITINLLLDNEVIDTQEVIADADGNWLYHFQDLSELAEGTSYSVQEVEVKGYKATYGEDGTITNKLTPTDPKKPTGTTSPKNPTLPSTGDTSWAWYGLMVLALGSTVIYTGRRRKEKE